MSAPRLFTIPPGAPFLPTLAEELLAGRLVPGLDGAEALAPATVYLPTRRAGRAFAAELARRAGRRALLLPRIVPLGDVDDRLDESLGFESADVPLPPIAPLERRLILTRLVQRWASSLDRQRLGLSDEPHLVPSSPADAVGLAADLEALMDALAHEEIDWEGLKEAVEAEHSRYFGLTLEFLRIAQENWPKVLDERNACDPARRRNSLIAAEAKRLAEQGSPVPVIAAGSTGSLPATAGLLAAIARLPNGAVVLPGLDLHLDEASYDLIGAAALDDASAVHGHPQIAMRRFLDRFAKASRRDVVSLGAPSPAADARARVLSEALRPAESTDRWASVPVEERSELARAGCAGLTLIEALDEREEALAIALAMREALEGPDATVALVTPDRALATRVAAELARWGIEADDSAGLSLASSEMGRLARLAADAAAEDFAPRRLLALLAHPQLRLGLTRDALDRAVAALEIGALRGPAPGPGLSSLQSAIAVNRAAEGRAPRPRRRLTEADWRAAADLVRRLSRAFIGFDPLVHEGRDEDLIALAQQHRAVVQALIDPDPRETVADGSDEALFGLFDELALVRQDGEGVLGRFAEYPAFFARLAQDRVVAPARRDGRVRILGLLEARLLQVDRVVLGGLDEGVWPPRAETDAFLNRPMRSRVGLLPPERRIGQTAHDFVQLLGTHDAVITRAHKRDQSPTVPSRFLQRLGAFVGEAVWGEARRAGERYRRWAALLDAPEVPAAPASRPEPRPDPALVPRALSVTEVETLIRDPYAVFARHILKLDALDAVAGQPGAAERGTLIHNALAKFAEAHPGELPPDADARLIQIGVELFRPLEDAFPALHAEWWPRFERLAEAFVAFERKRRPELTGLHVERSGALAIPLADGSTFTLKARADRIEACRDGRTVVLDYKTGTTPSHKEIAVGFSPQLTLEAAMLRRGAFKDVAPAPGMPELVYVKASGGRSPLEAKAVEPPRGETRSLEAIAEEHLARLTTLVQAYLAGERAFVSRPYPKYVKHEGDYAHLARVKEWSVASIGQEGSA
jgi:ATP-dependent helicase/nuclease subunit B